ncbi:MAG: hypothetical protein Q6373_006225 [Candidatus Sigynarchaeota archaeon]
MIISNTSPLIHLTKLGKIDPLLQCHGKIIIPQAVFKEAVADGIDGGHADAIFLKNLISQGKIEIREVHTQDRSLQEYLHQGEYEAIQLALELKVPVIIDDKKSRTVAINKHVKHFTSLLVLLDLFDANIITFDHFKSNALQYSAFGWISNDIVQAYIQEAESRLRLKEKRGE